MARQRTLPRVERTARAAPPLEDTPPGGAGQDREGPMRRAEICRAMLRAGLHVEAEGRRVRGHGDGATVYGRDTGRGWKLRTERTGKAGRIVATEAEAVDFCREVEA